MSLMTGPSRTSTDTTSGTAQGLTLTDLVKTYASRGRETVTAVKGGLEIPAESGGDAIIIANAAVIVSLDDGAND